MATLPSRNVDISALSVAELLSQSAALHGHVHGVVDDVLRHIALAQQDVAEAVEVVDAVHLRAARVRRGGPSGDGGGALVQLRDAAIRVDVGRQESEQQQCAHAGHSHGLLLGDRHQSSSNKPQLDLQADRQTMLPRVLEIVGESHAAESATDGRTTGMQRS